MRQVERSKFGLTVKEVSSFHITAERFVVGGSSRRVGKKRHHSGEYLNKHSHHALAGSVVLLRSVLVIVKIKKFH